ncbi:MAG: efflux RND transporter periplasmic adaptor subunit [Sandaracinaceae bacterium]|nr:efflux RND transporter periplasmic adaptor subunit [Myxococcales bacterium]MCB9657711.1 efflux RND transporter periplasmic adaptor subunit [Sandaracinaceae bacterium]
MRSLACALLLSLPSSAMVACSSGHAEHHTEEAHHPVVLTNPAVMDFPTSEEYVSQIHSRRHVEIRALDEGYLRAIPVQEGQAVTQGQLMFKLLPVVYRARLDSHRAELHLAEIRVRNARQLFEQHIVSDQEVAMAEAERNRARAENDLAEAEFRFTNIVAPFDGIMDRQYVQEGSLVEAGDMLTTVSDNSLMWVYFNVPEADYLRFRAIPDATDPEHPQTLRIPGARVELRLANGALFDQVAAETLTIESTFDNETGNIQFRADFPNPANLLRHGQTGTLVINETLHDVLVIPQRAVFDVLDKQYVFVVDAEGIAHQREITVSNESDDVFVISRGLTAEDRIVLDGVRQVHDGEHIESTEFRSPEDGLSHLKQHAE